MFIVEQFFGRLLIWFARSTQNDWIINFCGGDALEPCCYIRALRYLQDLAETSSGRSRIGD